MRKAMLLIALMLAACSKQEPGGRAAQDLNVADTGPTEIAGVAINYEYQFVLPVNRVAAVQEEHAMQCEALGPARCRITASHYQATSGRGISASLQLKLAPSLARQFGKRTIATVADGGGMLVESDITSSEAGAAIAATDKQATSYAAEERQLSASLAKPGLGSVERAQLQARVAELRESQRKAGADRADAAALLASTPMALNYTSGIVDTAFTDNAFVLAIRDGWRDMVRGALTIMSILIALLPWAAAAAVLTFLWRRYAVRLGLRRPPEEL